MRALKALDQLVVIEPFMTETARLAHYVLPPRLPYERADIPLAFPMPYDGPFAQYTGPAATDPPDSELVEDWQVFYGLAQRLGLQIDYAGTPLDMAAPPETDELLSHLCSRSLVPFDAVRQVPGGSFFQVETQRVLPAREGAQGRFALAPDDVVAELAGVLNEHRPNEQFTHRLVCRRMREVMNTAFRDLPSTRRRYRYNPAFLHPDDLAAQGLLPGDHITIRSDHGAVAAIVAADPGVRPGVVSISHGWGGLPDDDLTYDETGAALGRLISTDRDIEAINAMPRMSAIPVSITE